MIRSLITGGAGFIGLHLATHLADEEAHVTLVDDFSRRHDDADLRELLSRPNVTLVRSDLTDSNALRALGGFDEVYHLAGVLGVENVARNPDRVLRVNAIATLNVLDWWVRGGAERLLFASTSETYAWTQQVLRLPVPTPEAVPLALTDLTHPRASYAGSKIFGELATLQYSAQYRLPAVCVRYHNVYGPRMGMDHAIPQIASRAASGEVPLRLWSADHTRAFCYVSDAVEMTVRAMRSDSVAGSSLNVGNDREECSIAGLARAILEALDVEIPIDPQFTTHDPIRRRCPDCTRARNLLAYEPLVPLSIGLERTLAWYRAHGLLEKAS